MADSKAVIREVVVKGAGGLKIWIHAEGIFRKIIVTGHIMGI